MPADENDGQATFSGSPFSMNEQPPDMLDALQKCWSHDPIQRPTANYCYDVFSDTLKSKREYLFNALSTNIKVNQRCLSPDKHES